MARPNLTVLTGLQVSKLDMTGTQVTGVSATTGAGNPLDIRAKREVIISAGVIGTPKLLELSGIGDRDVLDNAGIQTRVASPGVGSNLQDHYVVRLGFRVRGAGTANERSHGLALAREMMRYVVSGTGVLTYSAAIVGAFAQTRFAKRPDVQYVIAPAVSRRDASACLRPSRASHAASGKCGPRVADTCISAAMMWRLPRRSRRRI